MAKIKKAFKIDFQENMEDLKKKEDKKSKKAKIIWNFSNIFIFFIKIICYILLCIFVSLGATAIFNSNIREMILQVIK